MSARAPGRPTLLNDWFEPLDDCRLTGLGSVSGDDSAAL